MIIDGLDALRAEIGVDKIAALIERTARWAAPETFKLMPVWYPEYSRRSLMYKANWSAPLMNTTRKTGVSAHKPEGNMYANLAITLALGLSRTTRPNWSCCHLWGIDDPTFQKSNDVVSDRRFYSCIANMVLLPTPLKAFTDSMTEIKTMLRLCARNLYGWQCDHDTMKPVNSVLDNWSDWSCYPKSWPRERNERRPLGVVDLTPTIATSAAKRLATIRENMQHAGEFYPRAEVHAALEYWGISEG